ncbi:hypothetical protein APORC_1256 [Arcobacter porcinus]|uniref:Uncharacterized protein n=1 Tax=Arcobacter porcinus TaxID=1935204 RepID=A0A5C2HHS9_9BACT|nr:hypothetical protein APORC_1256 [Arcobacter porcinus]
MIFLAYFYLLIKFSSSFLNIPDNAKVSLTTTLFDTPKLFAIVSSFSISSSVNKILIFFFRLVDVEKNFKG